MDQSGKLTNLQLELLKVFSYELPDSQLKEVKKLLSDYFSKFASDEMDRLWDANGWDENTMTVWANEHMRSKQK